MIEPTVPSVNPYASDPYSLPLLPSPPPPGRSPWRIVRTIVLCFLCLAGGLGGYAYGVSSSLKPSSLIVYPSPVVKTIMVTPAPIPQYKPSCDCSFGMYQDSNGVWATTMTSGMSNYDDYIVMDSPNPDLLATTAIKFMNKNTQFEEYKTISQFYGNWTVQCAGQISGVAWQLYGANRDLAIETDCQTLQDSQF